MNVAHESYVKRHRVIYDEQDRLRKLYVKEFSSVNFDHDDIYDIIGYAPKGGRKLRYKLIKWSHPQNDHLLVAIYDSYDFDTFLLDGCNTLYPGKIKYKLLTKNYLAADYDETQELLRDFKLRIHAYIEYRNNY